MDDNGVLLVLTHARRALSFSAGCVSAPVTAPGLDQRLGSAQPWFPGHRWIGLANLPKHTRRYFKLLNVMLMLALIGVLVWAFAQRALKEAQDGYKAFGGDMVFHYLPMPAVRP